MEKHIKHLIIDFGIVLVGLDYAQCIKQFKQLGIADIEQSIGLSHKSDFFFEYEKGTIDTNEFRQHIRRLTDKPLTDQEIDNAWNSFLINIPTYKLELLIELRKKYNLYLLSNTNEMHWEWSCQHLFPYKGYKAEDYFDKIFLSYKMKMIKPEKEIYTTLLEDTGILPTETFLIDDSVQNCLTAESLGITTYSPQDNEDWSHLFE